MGWADRAKEALRREETVTVRPRGHSMRPKVNDGDLVTLVPCVLADLAVGSIVLVAVGGNDYLHLVTALDGQRAQIAQQPRTHQRLGRSCRDLRSRDQGRGIRYRACRRHCAFRSSLRCRLSGRPRVFRTQRNMSSRRCRRAIDYQTSAMLETLARLRTAGEMRICLRDGRTENELRYMSLNMDLATLDECIERVVHSALEERARGGDPRSRQQLLDCLQDHCDDARGAIGHALRRASCMPFFAAACSDSHAHHTRHPHAPLRPRGPAVPVRELRRLLRRSPDAEPGADFDGRWHRRSCASTLIAARPRRIHGTASRCGVQWIAGSGMRGSPTGRAVR